MKKTNNKGFTLIELLAVIVVLAIVLVITIPAVLGSINDSRVKAFQASADSIAHWFEQQYGYCLIESDEVDELYMEFADDKCTIEEDVFSADETEQLFKNAGASLKDYNAAVTVNSSGRACVVLDVSNDLVDSKFEALAYDPYAEVDYSIAQSSGCQ